MSNSPIPLTVHPVPRLAGAIPLPGDKSLSHRALLLAAMAQGTSHLMDCNLGADVQSTVNALQKLGVTIQAAADGFLVSSQGPDSWKAPGSAIDCGNSGTTARLLMGVLSSLLGVEVVLTGDMSLRSRPMQRVIEPLRKMGASLVELGASGCLPLQISGGELQGITWRNAPPSAQVKGALLLAGLRAHSATTIVESEPTRDHTERLLAWLATEFPHALQEPLVTPQDGGGAILSVTPQLQDWPGFDLRIPKDPSAAAFWMVAALAHTDAELTLPEVLWNPTRNGLVELLGPLVMIPPLTRLSGPEYGPEAVWTPVIRSATIPPFQIGPGFLPASAVIDELPVLALLATQATGRSVIMGAGELRVKESDRLNGTAAILSALGADITLTDDGWIIEGPTPLHGGSVATLGDHRLAMMAAIAGLIASGPVTLDDAGCFAISDPGFVPTLQALGAVPSGRLC